MGKVLELSEKKLGVLERPSTENHFKNPKRMLEICDHVAVCQNHVPLVKIKIAGKWMFIPLKMVLIGIDP
jgi:hypothetical protein